MYHSPSPAEIPGYDIIGLLGEGSMGSVYQARQRSTDQSVAIKMLRIDPHSADARIDRLIARFGRETALCAKLHHPHIVRLIDRGTLSRHLHYAVFEYLPGRTLREHLLRQGALPPARAAHLMMQVLDGLACAHAAGVIHRDIKPQNIMVHGEASSLNATIVDFGIGALLDEQHATPGLTMLTQEALGTPSYSAPEQLRGEPPTPRSDLYAWGLLFVECLTGQPVFHGHSLPEIYHAQLGAHDVPLPPGLIGHPLHALLRKVLAKTPEDRWGDAAAVYRMLAAMNVANLATLAPEAMPGDAGLDGDAGSAPMRTLVVDGAPARVAYEKRQITAMYCGMSMRPVAGAEIDLDTIEALQRDHLNTVVDTVHRFGGHMVGSLASAQLFYFGYPQITDRDGQRAARAALELVTRTQQRARLLKVQQGIHLSLSIGLHVGEVLLTPDMQTGQTAAIAQALQHSAPPGHIQLSDAARRALSRFVECVPAPASATAPAPSDDAQDTPPPAFLLVREHNTDGFSFLDQGAAPLAGRQTELAELARLWQATRDQGGGAALVEGEAGIGKSRLLFEWAAGLGTNALCLTSACLPEHRHTALYPVLQWVRQHFELDEARASRTSRAAGIARLRASLQGMAADADHVTALLLSWMGLAPSDIPAALAHFSPEMQKQLLLDGLMHVLLGLSPEQPGRPDQPVCLLLEDVHWIDQSSAAFLDALIPQLASRHILLVMSARQQEMRWQPPAGTTLIQLSGLPSEAMGALLSAQLDGAELDPAIVAALHEHTGGVPLYIAELTAFLQDNGLLVRQGDAYRLTARLSPDILPTSLTDTLGHALQRTGAAKETAQLASAIGREFDHAMLAEVSPCDEATLQTHLQQLLQAGLITPCRRVGDAHYIFRHALLRSAAYDTMPKGVRESAHADIAAALEARLFDSKQADWQTLARHHAAAAQHERAVHFGIRSAESALQRALHDEALALIGDFSPLLDKIEGGPRHAHALALQRLKVSALMSRLGWAHDEVRQAADAGYEAACQSGAGAQAVSLLWSLATYHHVAGNRAQVRAIAEQLLQHRATPDGAHLAQPALAISGVAAWIDGRYQDADRHLREALAEPLPADRMGMAVLYGLDCAIWARAALANVAWFIDPDETLAHRLVAQAVQEADALGHIPSLGIALMYQAFVHQLAGQRDACTEVSQRLRELGTTYGLPAFSAYATLIHSWATGGTDHAAPTLTHLRHLGCMLGQTYFHALLAETTWQQGRADEALALCDEGLRLSEHLQERYYAPELYRLRARILASQGLAADAGPITDAQSRAASLADTWQFVRSVNSGQAQLA